MVRRDELEQMGNRIRMLEDTLKKYADPLNWKVEGGKIISAKVDLNEARLALGHSAVSAEEFVALSVKADEALKKKIEIFSAQWLSYGQFAR